MLKYLKTSTNTNLKSKRELTDLGVFLRWYLIAFKSPWTFLKSMTYIDQDIINWNGDWGKGSLVPGIELINIWYLQATCHKNSFYKFHSNSNTISSLKQTEYEDYRHFMIRNLAVVAIYRSGISWTLSFAMVCFGAFMPVVIQIRTFDVKLIFRLINFNLIVFEILPVVVALQLLEIVSLSSFRLSVTSCLENNCQKRVLSSNETIVHFVRIVYFIWIMSKKPKCCTDCEFFADNLFAEWRYI